MTTITMDTGDLVLVTGGGGFIGGHLVAELRRRGHRRIRAVDVKPRDDWYQTFDDVDNRHLDLRERDACSEAAEDARYVFNLAADMGGMGFIEKQQGRCACSRCSSTRTCCMAAQEAGVERYLLLLVGLRLRRRQADVDRTSRRFGKRMPIPRMPEDGYGWEKLFSERMCRHFREDFGLATRVARYHNVYGPHGTYDGGREKAPAAICRKVIAAKLSGKHEIEIWGDGEQTRSFMYIDDCMYGTLRDHGKRRRRTDQPRQRRARHASTSSWTSSRSIAGVKLKRRYKLDAPKGVRGRNSDNTLITERLGWTPSIRLEDGLRQTYDWIYSQMTAPESARHRVFV